MPISKETIGEQIKRIQKLRPNRHATGMLYNKKSELRRKPKKITLVGLFVSDEQTFLIRPHLFESREARTPTEWEAWLAEKYGAILPNILDGMENRTGKQWRLYRIIGWLPDDNTRLIRAKASAKRNKTKSPRGKNGRNSTRSR